MLVLILGFMWGTAFGVISEGPRWVVSSSVSTLVTNSDGELKSVLMGVYRDSGAWVTLGVVWSF